MTSAAITIQRSYKRYKARKAKKAQLDELPDLKCKDVAMAAVKIQSAYRGFQTRKSEKAVVSAFSKPVKPAAAKPVKPARPAVLRSQISLKDKRPMANRPRFVKVDERDSGTRSNVTKKAKKFQPGLKTEVEKPSQV